MSLSDKIVVFDGTYDDGAPKFVNVLGGFLEDSHVPTRDVRETVRELKRILDKSMIEVNSCIHCGHQLRCHYGMDTCDYSAGCECKGSDFKSAMEVIDEIFGEKLI